MSTRTDQLPNVKTRDQKRVTPRHHDPVEITCAPVGAPVKIHSKIHCQITFKITGGPLC